MSRIRRSNHPTKKHNHRPGIPLTICFEGGGYLFSALWCAIGRRRFNPGELCSGAVTHFEVGIVEFRRNCREHLLDRPAAALISVVIMSLSNRKEIDEPLCNSQKLWRQVRQCICLAPDTTPLKARIIGYDGASGSDAFNQRFCTYSSRISTIYA